MIEIQADGVYLLVDEGYNGRVTIEVNDQEIARCTSYYGGPVTVQWMAELRVGDRVKAKYVTRLGSCH